jgi:hypothetical protein
VKNSTKRIGLIPVIMTAFLCAIILMVLKGIAERNTENEWLPAKQATAISCNKIRSHEPGSSGDKNNGSGCAHQPGESCLLAISAEKRNKIHSC